MIARTNWAKTIKRTLIHTGWQRALVNAGDDDADDDTIAISALRRKPK